MPRLSYARPLMTLESSTNPRFIDKPAVFCIDSIDDGERLQALLYKI